MAISRWAPLTLNLTENKTKCSLYFKEYVPTSFADAVVRCGKLGKPATTCIKKYASLDSSLIEDDTADKNLRYTGANPSNYVTFNGNEKWRIIGIIDGKLKIMRNEKIGDMAWADDFGDTDWASSKLTNYFNNTYQINSNLVVETSWGVGDIGSDYFAANLTANQFYVLEQGSKWTGKVGLMTPNDYGYAVGSTVRNACLNSTLGNYKNGNCAENDWLYIEGARTMIRASGSATYIIYNKNVDGHIGYGTLEFYIYPVVYLNANTRITGGNGSSTPFTLSL